MIKLWCNACIQWIHYKLSATFSEKYRWLNFTRFLGLHNAMDKIKASLALYIARTIMKGLACKTTAYHAATNLKFWRYTALSSSSLWLKHRNLLLSRLRVLHLHDFWRWHLIWTILLTTFYHMHHYIIQLLGIWSSVHLKVVSPSSFTSYTCARGKAIGFCLL